MASSVAQADLKKDKVWLVIFLLIYVVAFCWVFRPIQVIPKQSFTKVYYTYQYERPFGPGARAKDEISTAVHTAINEQQLGITDAVITFPATTDIKISVPVETGAEADALDPKLQALVDKVLAGRYGRRLAQRVDKSGFPEPPLFALIPGKLGVYRPRLHLKLGLDLQGGVHLVLQARTQNVEFEYKLADTAAELVAALDAADKTDPLAEPTAQSTGGATPSAAPAAATPAPVKGAAPAAPVKGAAPAAKGATPAPATPSKPAEAGTNPQGNAAVGVPTQKPAPASPATAAEANKAAPKAPAKSEPGKTAPDGGQPIRMAQVEDNGQGGAPADTGAPADENAPATPAPSLQETSVSPEEAERLADEQLRLRVEDRINDITAKLKQQYRDRIGDVNAEVVSSNIVILRTYVDLKNTAESQQTIKGHQSLLLSGLQRVFPKVKMLREPEPLNIDPQKAMSDVSRIIGERIDRLGVAEATVVKQGSSRVVVELPGVKDPDEAVQILGTTARMEFRKVPDRYTVNTEQASGSGGRNQVSFVLKDSNKSVPDELVYYEAPEFGQSKNILVGSDLQPNSVQVSYDQEGKPAISLSLNRTASARFDAFANENQGSYIAIYLDRKCIDARAVKERHYGGKVLLTGGFNSIHEATNLKILLDAGALPVPVDVVEQRAVSATLGADSVKQSFRAAGTGLILIAVLMISLYKVPGVLACLALIDYALIVLTALVAVGASLTLPGVLGFVLSIGMAVDGNVIAFERLKEELRHNPTRPIVQAIRNSYDRSFAPIFDGHVTCLITATILFLMGTGPVRGFAVTLFVGTVASLFTNLIVTRHLQNLLASTRLGSHRSIYRT